ncbi:MAG: hypothetical protein KIT80_18010 [Chitinophagaceae bacterium]|nr:hypothetical protein [Chitinophagaceae bacterium]MCW5928821.1 hypothetical protein [Chitinophagaceae bacterium]
MCWERSAISVPGVDGDSGTVIDYYVAGVLTAQDYYVFGMIMPGRNYRKPWLSYKYVAEGEQSLQQQRGGVIFCHF